MRRVIYSEFVESITRFTITGFFVNGGGMTLRLSSLEGSVLSQRSESCGERNLTPITIHQSPLSLVV